MSRGLYEGADDVRASIARLEARARQMAAQSDNSTAAQLRVIRNARSVLLASNAVLAEAAAAPQRPIPETSQAATELFLANTVGFNLQEQQRLLRHIAANRPNVTTTVASDTTSDITHVTAIDLEVALAQRRARGMKLAVDDVHRRIYEARKEASEAAISAYGDAQVNRITELLGLQSLQLLNVGNNSGPSTALASRAKEEREVKMTAFANAVEATPASEWATVLPNVGIELQGGDISEPVAALWSTVQGIASQQPSVMDGTTAVPTETSTLTAVSCSRAVLEEKFLLQIFGSVLGTESLNYEDLCRMHPTKVRGIITKYCQTMGKGTANDVWYEVYIAMRAGCYDTARLIAQESGKGTLANLLGNVAAAPAPSRGRIRCNSSSVASLWNEPETRANAYRCAVLVILNGCNFNSSDESGVKQLISVVVERVASSIEDILWLRLCLVSDVDGDAESDSPTGATSSSFRHFQSLRELQRTILDDQQNILQLVGNDRLRFASVLVHVLLPSNAIRLLLDNPATYVDGVHMALVFAASGLLRAPSQGTMVSGADHTDLPRLLRRYATQLLEVPHRITYKDHPSRTIFHYFTKADCASSFAQLCQNEVIATKLFGSADDLQSREGALLHSATPDTTLLLAMEAIAQNAVTEGNLRLAIQILTTIESLSVSGHDGERAVRALRSAIQALCTAMSHAIHSSGAAARETYQLADKLFHFVERKSSTDVPVGEIDAFRSLRAMLNIHICAGQGDEEGAMATIKSIPYIPTSAAAVESCIRKYREMVSTDAVATAMPQTCVVIMRLYQSSFHREVSTAQRRAVIDRAQALVLWCRRWPNPPSADVLDGLQTIQHQMTASA